jgi:uncharacterized CHY-type Zn-finger protein
MNQYMLPVFYLGKDLKKKKPFNSFINICVVKWKCCTKLSAMRRCHNEILYPPVLSQRSNDAGMVTV